MFQGGNYVFKHIFDINWHQFAPESYQKPGPLKGQIKGQVKRFTKTHLIFYLFLLLDFPILKFPLESESVCIE